MTRTADTKKHAEGATVIAARPSESPVHLTRFLYLLIAIGVVTILAGVLGFRTQRVWISYLVNFCLWSGLAQAGVIFSAAYRLTNGRWGETLRRVAEGFVIFIPVSAVLFLVTLLGRKFLWPWMEHPLPEKSVWLNEPFFYVRVVGSILLLSILSLRYVWISIRPEIGLLSERGRPSPSWWAGRMLAHLADYESEASARDAQLARFVPILLIAYAVLYSLLGFDIVMSLDPHWYSTLYGWLYFVHAFDAGVAGTIIVAILARKFYRLEEFVSTKQFYDVSRLLMGLCMLAGGLYWAQYLVMWYGNLGEEIPRLIVRFSKAPWPVFQWSVIVLLYFFPIVVFLSRSVKEKPRYLLVIASVILAGNWLYQFVEVAPAVWNETWPPLGLPELGITVGFAGAVGLSWLAYARVVPLVPGRAPQDLPIH